MRLPDEYRWLEPSLHDWVQWSRRDNNRLDYPRENILYRMEREIRVGASHRIDPSVPRETYCPEDVERTDQAIRKLGQRDRNWQAVVLLECLKGLPHHHACRKLRVGKTTHWAWRRHAYGVLAEDLAQHIDGVNVLVLNQPSNIYDGRFSPYA